jgi:hypothetical protein
MVDLYVDDDLEGCMKPAMKQCYNGKCEKKGLCRRFTAPGFDFRTDTEIAIAQHCAARCQMYYPHEKKKTCLV